MEQDYVELTIDLDCKSGTTLSDEGDIRSLLELIDVVSGAVATIQSKSSGSVVFNWTKRQKRQQDLIVPFFESVLAVIRILFRSEFKSGIAPMFLQYTVEGHDIASIDVHISSYSAEILREFGIDVCVRARPDGDVGRNSLTPCKGCWFDAAINIYSDNHSPEIISSVLEWDPCRVMSKCESDNLSNPIAVFGWYFNIESKRTLPDVLLVKLLNMFKSRSEELNSLAASCRVRAGVALFLTPSRHGSAVMRVPKEVFKDLEEIGVNDGLRISFYFM